MSTEEILNNVLQLSLSEKMIVMEQLLTSIKSEALSVPISSTGARESDIKKRRKAFKVETFDLGQDVIIDRDELYLDRGV